jgi:hypothetical protein
MTDYFVWIGILFCLSQSAMFSGLNLAFFSISRLRLETEADAGNQAAAITLAMRRDSNFLLTTILWGNVGINVLLTLLSNSALAGITAFFFSTVLITFFGEIMPQAYFSRRALRMASALSPVMRFYQYLLYPVAKPCAWLLDQWLGAEGISLLREKQLKSMIEKHIESDTGEIDAIEGTGALNFLDIDDVPISDEGEPVDPDSVISLDCKIDLPVLPEILRNPDDPFIQQVNRSGRKWVILQDHQGTPRLVLDSDALLRFALIDPGPVDPYQFCHRPVVVDDAERPLGFVISDFRRGVARNSDDVISRDVVLLWTDQHKRVITGADVLGRLLRGIN